MSTIDKILEIIDVGLQRDSETINASFVLGDDENSPCLCGEYGTHWCEL